MAHPSEDVLQDLTCGDLPEPQRQETLAHVRGCADCQATLRELLVIYRGIAQLPALEPCPAQQVLNDYARGMLAPADAARVGDHLSFCEQCASHVELITASPADLARKAAAESTAVQAFEARELGRRLAEESLGQLLPSSRDLLGQLWDRVVEFVDTWRAKGASLLSGEAVLGQFSGALGFSGRPDPQARATAIICATALISAYAVENGEIGPAGAEDFAHRVATQLGAGTELSARLSGMIAHELR